MDVHAEEMVLAGVSTTFRQVSVMVSEVDGYGLPRE
jgi:hypothetical protein